MSLTGLFALHRGGRLAVPDVLFVYSLVPVAPQNLYLRQFSAIIQTPKRGVCHGTERQAPAV